MSRILLVYPPSRTQLHDSCPMGIQLIAAVLEKNGYEPILLDANAAKRPLNVDQVVEEAKRLRPDLIGITLVTPLIRQAYSLAAKLKGAGFTVLAGGPHATLRPEEVVEQGFDAAVIGEGEDIILHAIRGLRGEIPKNSVLGWTYRDDNGRVTTTEPRPTIQNLDDIPFPARHLINKEWYRSQNGFLSEADMFSSRGCTARCSFCSGQLFGKRFRFRSAKNILDEMEHLHGNYGTNVFHFVDDAFTLQRTRLAAFCQGLVDRKLDVTWTIMTRIDAIDEPFLRMIRKAGCTQIDFGVESGHPATLRKIHKPHTVEMVQRAISMTAQAGIIPNVFFILGFPWEDVNALEDTLRLMKELAPHVGLFHPAVASIIIPFPGTEIYDQYRKDYGFENWWLSEEKNYDALLCTTGSYFEEKIFHLGNILRADFFHYEKEIKGKIREIFEFMYFHNLSQQRGIRSIIQRNLLKVSKTLDAISGPLERSLFAPIRIVEKKVKKLALP